MARNARIHLETVLKLAADAGDDCVRWPGYIHKDGYGRADTPARRGQTAQRAVYEFAIGPIPEGMSVDHTCFTPACANPRHLRLLPIQTNRQLQRSAIKQFCVNGHEFTPENTYIRPRRYRGGCRQCRQCNRNEVAAYKARQREKKRTNAA